MDNTLADLERARREAEDSDAWVEAARSRIDEMEREGHDTTDAPLLLKHLEAARRKRIERLGEIRRAIGPSAY